MRAKSASRLIKILVLLILVAPVIFFQQTQAAELQNRRLALASSLIGVTTQHDISFNIVTPGNIGSFAFEYCENSPIILVACDPPSNLDVTAAALSAEVGETGFSVHPNTTANRLVISRGVALAGAGPVQYTFDDILNADTLGQQYMRIYTYPTDDGTGPETDSGAVAYALTSGIDVSTFVPPVLVFCVAVSITSSDCTNTVGSNINFGDFTPTETSYATTQMVAATNGVGGYSITVDGTTMTSGNNIIPQLSAGGGSSTGNSQFGLNLRNNATPNVGQNITGAGTGSVTAGYNIPNNFRFNDGDVVASSALSTDYNKYTVSYIVNINPAQEPGYYAATISYIALATF